MSSTLRRRLPALSVLLLLAACAPVTHQRDEAVTIPAGATVALEGDRWVYEDDLDPAVDDDVVHRHIREVMAAELGARGFEWLGQAKESDFLLSYYVAARRDVPVAVRPAGSYGTSPTAMPGWGWGWSGDTVTRITPRDFASDAFVVQLVERSTGRVAWRAAWHAEPSPTAPSREELEAKFRQLFRSLPVPG